MSGWPAHAVRVDDVPGLARIYEPTRSLVSLPWDCAPDARAALEARVAAVDCFDWTGQTSPAGEGLERGAERLGGEAASVWLEQARALVKLFADLFEHDQLGVRLAVTTAAPCPRFHVDRVVCRGIFAVGGPGTEFLADADARRARLGAGEQAVERPGAAIHQLAPWELGLFKGEAWPGFDGRGVVHRSPAASGQRLLMTLDLL